MRRTVLAFFVILASGVAQAQGYYPYARHDAILSHGAADAAHHDRVMERHFDKVGDYRGAQIERRRAAQRSYESHYDAAMSHRYLDR